MLLICDETTSHAGRIAWLVKPDKPTHDAIASMCGLFVGYRARGCYYVCPNCDTIRHRVKKQSIKTCLSAQQVFILPFFHRSSTLRRNHSSITFRALTCGFFLVSAFTGIAVGVFCTFSLRHFVPSDTAAPTPPRAVGISQSFASGTALQQVATSLMLRIHPLSNASPVGANSSTPVGVLRETLLTRKAFARRHPLIGGILACPVMRT